MLTPVADEGQLPVDQVFTGLALPKRHCSDHAPILLEGNLTLSENYLPSQPNRHSFLWNRLRGFLRASALPTEPQAFCTTLASILPKAQAAPRQHHTNQAWWTWECRQALTNKEKLSNKVSIGEASPEMLEEAVNLYGKVRKEAQRRWRLQVARDADQNPWRAINQLVGGTTQGKALPRTRLHSHEKTRRK